MRCATIRCRHGRAPRKSESLAGLQRANRLQAAAILVAERKPVQQIFDREQTDPLEIGRAARPDAFEEL
jgi:hypothetical protein